MFRDELKMALNDGAIISANILNIFACILSIPAAFEILSCLNFVATLIGLIWEKTNQEPEKLLKQS